MRRFLFLVMLVVGFTNCKNDKGPEPMREIEGIAGNWHLTDLKYVSGDSTITVKINKEQKDLFIRYDGVMLYDGKGACCVSREYLVNGILFKVVPKEEVNYEYICDCRYCEQLVITQTGDEMTIVACYSTSTYTRVK